MRIPWRIAFGIGVLAVEGAGAQSVADRAELRKLNQEAAAAHERRDYSAFLDLSRRVVEKAPRSVGALYNLACAQALAGAPSEAIATLGRLAGRGVAFDLGSDSDLESLRGSPEFQAVARKMAALAEPFGSSTVAFTLPDKTLITEGIAYDAKSGDFFVSSVRHRKVVRVSKDGVASDFLAPRDGFYAMVALDVDPSKNVLWASSHASPQMEGYREADEGRSFVVELDLATGKVLRRIRAARALSRRASQRPRGRTSRGARDRRPVLRSDSIYCRPTRRLSACSWMWDRSARPRGWPGHPMESRCS